MTPALVVIDMQKRWIGDGTELHPSFDEAVDVIERVAAAFRAAGHPVVWVQDKETMPEDDPGFAVVDELTIHEGDRRVSKVASNAFAEDGLPNALDADGVDLALLCGYRAEQCVLATAKGAAERGLPYALLRGATLGPDAVAVQTVERDAPLVSAEIAVLMAEG